ncbi:MAG TPA: hypothetical protein VJN18_21260 [Polyangiaceae bacterium]|nr:hypothetical protein [Polyangiaceae bacterium]
MGGSKCCREIGRLGCCGLVLLAGTAFAASPATQLELTSMLGSGNLLAPGPGGRGDAAFGTAPEPPPFERWVKGGDARAGRARLELQIAEEGFLAHVETSARLALDLNLDDVARGATLVLRDASSWVGISWRSFRDWELGLRAFPIDTSYRRLGYLHALDWGGTDVSRRESIFLEHEPGVPGLELAVAAPRARLFMGLRWARGAEGVAGIRPLWGATLGGALELTRELQADFGLGYFQRPALTTDTGAETSFVEGASVRLVWKQGPVEPELSLEPFRPASLRVQEQGFRTLEVRGFAVVVEGAMLATRLRQFDAPGRMTLVAAPAAALYGSVRGEIVAAHAALLGRSLAFVLRNEAGLLRGESLPKSAQELPELGVWLGASATAMPWRVTPGLELGVMTPAALVTPSSLPGFRQTFVVREAQGVVALPVGSGRLPILAARASLRFQASPSTALAFYVDYERDANRVRFHATGVGAIRSFADPDQLRAGLAIQTRF